MAGFCAHGAVSVALSLRFPFIGKARVGLSCLETYPGTCVFRSVFSVICPIWF